MLVSMTAQSMPCGYASKKVLADAPAGYDLWRRRPAAREHRILPARATLAYRVDMPPPSPTTTNGAQNAGWA
jgi:hypothetical protein